MVLRGWMKAPCQSGRGRVRAGDLALGLLGRLALVPVDDEEGRDLLLGRNGRSLGQELGELGGEEPVGDLDGARGEAARLELGGQGARHGIAGLVLGPGGDRRRVGKIPGQGEERDGEAALGRPDGVGREEVGADLDADPRRALGAQRGEAAAALVQVVRGAEHLERRRRELDRDRDAEDGLVAAAGTGARTRRGPAPRSSRAHRAGPRSRPATARSRCCSAAGGAAKACCATTALAVPWTTLTSTDATPPRAAFRSTASGVFTPRNFGAGRSSARTPGTLCRHAK